MTPSICLIESLSSLVWLPFFQFGLWNDLTQSQRNNTDTNFNYKQQWVEYRSMMHWLITRLVLHQSTSIDPPRWNQAVKIGGWTGFQFSERRYVPTAFKAKRIVTHQLSRTSIWRTPNCIKTHQSLLIFGLFTGIINMMFYQLPLDFLLCTALSDHA